jgi:hypothetical protein
MIKHDQSHKRGERKILFRRYRRVRGGTKVLDAYDYGYEAWPILIGRKR